jgi:endonuclease/exonuclease/phosphatase (EEP) superfamily protein YafD
VRTVLFVVGAAMIVANTHAFGQANCDVIDECAKAALQTAQAALNEAQSLRQELQQLKAAVGTQEQSNLAARTAVQGLIDNSAKPPRIGTVTVSSVMAVQDVSCANGEYLVGVRYSWTGTCQRQCDGDGPILRSVAPICRKLQN